MMESALLIFCSCPDEAMAMALARNLVERRLAACVSLLPSMHSIYHWQGAIETASECLLLIKTTHPCYPELEQAIRARHPYEIPEILAIPIDKGLPAYLQWVEQCTATM
jgi:periplasmic divalent cation tolerance protein